MEELVLQRQNELLTANQDLENEILEIEELHHKIFQAERLKIVGEMAAGMLEVIENPVRTMDLEINSFRDELETVDPEIEEMAETLHKASTKVKKTLAKLNQYSLADKTDLKLTDLNEIVRNSVNLFKFRNREREIEFSLELSASIPLLLLDKVKIEGVLINLIMNAIDSFSGKGQIRIRTRNLGRNVVLTITDNGCGIDKVKLKDVFSPFFTTKETGYGLGLSIVHRNISAMHGSISFTSAIGKGTKVKIMLPGWRY